MVFSWSMLKFNFLFKLTIIFLFFFNKSSAELISKKLPIKDADIIKIYKLEDEKYIFIEQFIRGHTLWEYNDSNKKFTKISNVWNFIDLASKCEQINGYNIYFAHNLEYFFAGGTKVDNPEIRIFELYEPSPWRDKDLGITPSMSYAKEWCTFYKPYYIKKKQS